MKVGEPTKIIGAQVETIRHYEREGLLPETIRTEGNYRIWYHSHAGGCDYQTLINATLRKAMMTRTIKILCSELSVRNAPLIASQKCKKTAFRTLDH